VLAAESRYQRAVNPAAKRANRRFDGEGLFRCGSGF
jgi:hypothetical protein